MTYSEEVMEKIRSLQTTGADFANPKALAVNLMFLYWLIAASENLMVQGAEVAEGRTKEYYTTHLEEERDHAKWLAEDLLTWGIDVSKMPPMREAVELAGSQYYLMFHGDPDSLLGYMMALEGSPLPIELLEELEVMYGKPILRTVRYHAVHDLEHRKELFEVVNARKSKSIMINAVRTQLLLNELTTTLKGMSHG